MSDFPTHYEHHREQITLANSAIGGLISLQNQMLDDTETGEMPDWFSEYYRESIHVAISACVEKIETSIEWLKANAPEQPEHSA